MTLDQAVERAALAMQTAASGFGDPVHQYVEWEAALRWLNAHQDKEREDLPEQDWALESWKILARAVLLGAEWTP